MNSLPWTVLVLATLSVSSYAIIIDQNVTLDPRYIGIIFSTYAFNDNGSFSFTLHSVESDDPSLKPLLVVVNQDYWPSSGTCQDSTVFERAAVLKTLNSSAIGTTVEATISDQDVVAAIVLCDSHDDVSFSFTAVLMNGDNHLSAEDLPQPYLYIVAVSLWGVFLVAWMLNWILIRHVTKLHVAISCFIVLKIISVVYLMVYWIELNKIGTLDNAVSYGYYAVKIIESCAFFTVLLLIGVGWGMIDNKAARSWPLIATLVLLYGVFFGVSFFFYLVGIASILLLCVTTYVVYVAATRSCSILVVQYDGLMKSIKQAESQGGNTETGVNLPLLKSEAQHCMLQISMLRRFLYIMMAYVIGLLIRNFIVLFVTLDWVDSLLAEILDIGLFACIGWVFRLRKSKKEGMYFVLENEFEEYGVPMTEVTTTAEATATVADEAPADQPEEQ